MYQLYSSLKSAPIKIIAMFVLIFGLSACGAVSGVNSLISNSSPATLSVPIRGREATEYTKDASHEVNKVIPVYAIAEDGVKNEISLRTDVRTIENCDNVPKIPFDNPDMGFGAAYYCEDSEPAGLSSNGVTVISGNVSHYIPSKFGSLSPMGHELMGKEVYLKGENGTKFLVYTVTGLYDVPKDELYDIEAAWGDDGGSAAGRLVLVANQFDHSGDYTRNYVVIAKLTALQYVPSM